MKSAEGKKLIFCLISLAISLLIVVASTVAWFATGGGTSGNVVIFTGSLDLNVGFFQGVDDNKDGILDSEIQTDDKRATINSKLFKDLNDSKNETTVQNHLTVGSYLTYKAIVENPSSNTTNAKISLNFSNLENYFNELKNKQESEWIDVLLNHTGRIMYSIENIVVKVYTAVEGESDNSIYLGYSQIVETDKREERHDMWAISNEEKFIDNVIITPNQLVEIEFQMKCNSLEQTVDGYTKYLNEVISALDSKNDADLIEHIKKVRNAELQLIVENSMNSITEFSFSIDKIYINAESAPKE